MAHAPPPSVPVALPDRLVQVSVVVTAAAALAAALAWSGVPLKWSALAVLGTAATWAYQARRGQDSVWPAGLWFGGALLLALPLGGVGVFFAVLLAAVVTVVAWGLVGGLRRVTLIEGALDRLERLSLRAAISLGVAGVFAVAAPSTFAVSLGAIACASSIALLGWTLARDRRRARFFRALYAGDVATHRVSSDEDARGLEQLPPLLSGTITDAVLVTSEAELETYRGGTARRPVARCQKDSRDALGVIERRASVLVATLGAIVGASPIALGAHLRYAHAAVPIAVAAAPPAVVAPTCVEARPYFHETLPQAVHGVGRAVLLTHEQDPTIAAGNGVLLLVPEGGGVAPLEMRGAALGWANRVPCRDKLSLDVADPIYHPLTLSAWITLDGLVPAADVEREVRETVGEMFERDGRSVRVEHVDFGSEQHVFGYGVRYALRHVPGVKSVKLEVNGRDGDEPLGAREFPVLESFTLHVD